VAPDTAFLVASKLGWTRRPAEYADLDLFNQMLAILETHAHLEELANAINCTASGTAAHFATASCPRPEATGSNLSAHDSLE